MFIGRTDVEAETPILWPPNSKNWLIGKDPDAGKDWRQEEKGMTDGWMASLTRWTWVWVSSGSWWQTGTPGVLQSMGLQELDTPEQQNRTEVEPWPCHRAALLFLGCPTIVSASLPSLISNCSNLPFETQRVVEAGVCSLQTRSEETERLPCPGVAQGLCWQSLLELGCMQTARLCAQVLDVFCINSCKSSLETEKFHIRRLRSALS